MTRARFWRSLAAACAALCLISIASAQNSADLQARESAAARLFELPLYRELATRAIYEALASLPPEQQKQARGALRDPKTLTLLKQAIIRSAAATFSVREIDWLHRTLAAEEARSVVDKLDLFRVALLKETLAAALTNPELAPLLVPQ